MTATPRPLDLPAADRPDDARAWVRAYADDHLARVREAVDRLREQPPAEPLDVVRQWDDAGRLLGNVAAVGSLFGNVHPDEQVRTTAEAAEVAAMKLSTELSLDRGLYEVFSTLDADGLDPLPKRLLGRVLRDFERAGVDLDDASRERIAEINERLTTLDQEFSRIARDDVRTVRTTPDRLAGLPQDFLDSHRPDDEGLVTLTTDYPDSLPVRMFAHDAGLRAEMTDAFLNRGWPEAEPVLQEMFALRHELATTVGFSDWADYDAQVKMIGSGPAIPEFIAKITDAAQQPMERDLAVLLERYRQDHPDAERVTWADAMYYEEVVRRERFEVDAQQVRRYFDFSGVRQGLLDVTGRLFGVRYEPVPDAPVWHPEVTVYDVVDADAPAGAAPFGRIFLDLHPRDGKYKHAAQFTLTDGIAGKQLPEGVLVCNFSRDLMEHDHVVTLFHEFGHLVHHVLGGRGEWARFAGVATEWDFVEAPSQMLEQWAWDADILRSFAVDADGQPIPVELVARMRAGEEFGKGYQARQQMFYASVSYAFHVERPTDLTARMIELQGEFSPWPYPADSHFFASFGHLGGYSSAYYTYMWSQVIAKDLFSAFDPTDMFDPEVAGRYRDRVLAPGGSKDAADLVADFLGRPFTFDSFAAWLAG